MPENAYHFISHWRVKSTTHEVYDILGEPTDLVRWWPSVYLDVQELKPPDENGVGREVKLYTKGWLPYTLRWQFRVTETRKPHGFSLQARGDFDGRGVWTFEQDGEWVNITYDWKIHADKPFLRLFSWLLRPIFSANHRWAMKKGEESLKLEVQRRQQGDKGAKIKRPPGPTFPHNLFYRRRA